jgi:transaldolase / glucose-6-phosphate isomerase
VTTFTIAPGPLTAAFEDACARLDRLTFADALWNQRTEAFTKEPAVQRLIANRLGWVRVLDFAETQVGRVRAFAEGVRAAGFTDVLLLGMGGSSLAPEVISRVTGRAAGFPRFRMLDSVDPDAVRAAMPDTRGVLFVIASKSGSTIEPTVLAAEARRRSREAEAARWGGNAVAITDPDTVLQAQAQRESFRDVFVNPPDIGGRYSALSLFGLVPAALMGVDLDALLGDARAMANECRQPSAAGNPGLALGALMAAGAQQGRDKLTLLVPPRLASLGLWVEQLVAESTGKQGAGVVPIAGEDPAAPFGNDRVFVAVTLGDEAPDRALVDRARAAGAPFAEWRMASPIALGAEFYRWEVATAAAGALLGINPFDEPNVSQAKDATKALLDVYRTERRLPLAEPHGAIEGARITLSHTAADSAANDPLAAALSGARPPDYVAVLAYLPPDAEPFDSALREVRAALSARTGCASMGGYGPRYLHSTGQLHKGGPNSGVFLIVTAEPESDLAVPDEPFSFGVLEMAQALGDFQSLDRSGRRAVHVHLPRRDPALLKRVVDRLLQV